MTNSYTAEAHCKKCTTPCGCCDVDHMQSEHELGHDCSPPPTDALQKARELMQDLEDIGNMEGTRANVKTLAAFSVWQDSLSRAFPSIHAELEKVTAERDELLKGYRAMRSAIDIVTSGAKKDDKTGDMIVDNVEFGNLWIALTSFLK